MGSGTLSPEPIMSFRNSALILGGWLALSAASGAAAALVASAL
jgi:hypothetical protein